MRVFLTGATGFIGSQIVPELLEAGHQVVGLTRSDAGAKWLEENGAEAYRGTLEEPDGIARGAADADAVIHTAFDHDFANFVANCEKDQRVIRAIGAALAGSDRPFLITSGVALGSPGPGQPATEAVFNPDTPIPRRLTELAGEEVAQRGVSVGVVRLPQVHDTVKQGLVTPLVGVAREKGVSAYIGDGAARWSAAYVGDVARLYRLALEQHRPGARWHAVDEEGVPTRDIAETIAAGLGISAVSLPADQAGHFGWMAGFMGHDMTASSAITRERLGWMPTGPGLIEDLRNMDYTAATG